MPQSLHLCLEDCQAVHESVRYLRCTALVGRQPGLAMDLAGEVVWQGAGPVYFELWVSGDDRLICFRPAGAAGGTFVHREGRCVSVSEGKPVVVLDGDELEIPGRRFRLHLHAPTTVAVAPTWFVPEMSGAGRLAKFAAGAAMTLSALGAAACGKGDSEKTAPPAKPPIEVRTAPPDAPAPVMNPEAPMPGPPDMEAVPGEAAPTGEFELAIYAAALRVDGDVVWFEPDSDVRVSEYTRYALDKAEFLKVVGSVKPDPDVALVVKIVKTEHRIEKPADPKAPSPAGGFRITIHHTKVLHLK